MRIEQLQRRPANHVPATGRFDRINPGLPSADRDRAGRNLFARNIAPRGREPARQTPEKGKTGGESDAMNAVIGSAMKIDNLFQMNARVPCDLIEVEPELLVITNWNLNRIVGGDVVPGPPAVSPESFRGGYRVQGLLNPSLKPSKNIFDRRARVDRADRITKKRYRRVSGRDLNHARNLRSFERVLRREHFVKNVDRSIVKVLSDTNQQRGISERRNFHEAIGSAFLCRHCFLNSLDVLFDFADLRVNVANQIMPGLRKLFDALGHFLQFF